MNFTIVTNEQLLILTDSCIFDQVVLAGTYIYQYVKDIQQLQQQCLQQLGMMVLVNSTTCLLHCKRNSTTLLWIFEKLDELRATFCLQHSKILYPTGSFFQIFGYDCNELTGMDIRLLIHNSSRYTTARSKSGAVFPISAIFSTPDLVQISQYPILSGTAIVGRRHKNITHIDPAFASNMFGLDASRLMNAPISNLIPDFWDHHSPRNSLLSPFAPSRHFHSFVASSRSATLDTGGVLTRGRHADGNLINILLKSKLKDDTDEIVVSISFTYLHAVKSILEFTKDAPIYASPDILAIPDFMDIPIYQPRGDIEDFVMVKDLGEGAYGFVKLGYHKKDPEKSLFVIKYIVKTMILSWTRHHACNVRLPTEAAILISLNEHPHVNIPQLKTSFQDEFYFYLVIPYSHVQDLFDFIESSPELSESTVKHIFGQVARAVAHLHHLGIVHRDIKDENIVIDKNTSIQIIDFGSSAFEVAGPFSTLSGTAIFCSPEVLQQKEFTGKPQDIWAMGILLYTMIYRENPFHNTKDVIERDIELPFEMSAQVSSLIHGLLCRDINQRLDIDQVLNHEWLSI